MSSLQLPPLWPHQQRGLDGIKEAMNAGEKRILLTSPTGGGKSRMFVELIKWGFSTVVYSNRKMLTEQLARVLDAADISFGIRAAGHRPKLLERVQLSSIQTENERVFQTGKWELHDAALVLVDEAHSQTGDVAGRIIQEHESHGATCVGASATPLDCGDLWSHLEVAGTVSELRECGALVPAITYAPDEPAALLKKPDPKKPGVREPLEKDLTEPIVAKAMSPTVLFGRVLEHWKLLNPDARPTILFAPGVAESLYFAEQFWKAGIPAAHIDGSDVWINGQFYGADDAARDYLSECSETGRVKIVCNRFVLREGIDWPHLFHGIFATAFGSTSSYLQSGGRLLRQWYVKGRPQLEHVCIQDHGGNWWRHGSLNSDREWSLEYSGRVYQAIRKRRLREKQEAEPIMCPRCCAIRLWGRECFKCHYVHRTRSRVVLQTDGTLAEVQGDIYQPRRIHTNRTLVQQKWRSMYFRFKNAKRDLTFEQAMAMCAKESGWRWPPTDLPLMPRHEIDWFRNVRDVPTHRLIGEPHAN